MKAILTNNTESREFTSWKDLEEYLIIHPKRKQIHKLIISLYVAQKCWQYTLDLDVDSTLQVVHMLKNMEHRIDEIWQKYLDALPGD